MVTKDASLGLGRVEKPALARKAQRPLHGLPRGHSSEGAPAEGCEAGHLMNPAPEHNDACTCAFKSQTGVPAIGTLALGTTQGRGLRKHGSQERVQTAGISPRGTAILGHAVASSPDLPSSRGKDSYCAAN